jgi:hypothetical protein
LKSHIPSEHDMLIEVRRGASERVVEGNAYYSPGAAHASLSSLYGTITAVLTDLDLPTLDENFDSIDHKTRPCAQVRLYNDIPGTRFPVRIPKGVLVVTFLVH